MRDFTAIAALAAMALLRMLHEGKDEFLREGMQRLNKIN
jgi:hypothetical protein